ncbi:MAG: precorrin-6y C5,15-methyltransferase (decarboxylating) subunit CbiE [Nitrospinota bacterium]|nr:precorrin-6y C5,15-methyltransferase (decarboxylating) subunit CbiE [Nitrospinota bacterium]
MITIIGCGPGAPEYMTQAAIRAAEEADFIIGSKRLLEMIPGARGQKLENAGDVARAIALVEQKQELGNVAVMVSGDPGVSSLARPLIQKFGAGACRVIPGISSVQAAFAAIGEQWQDAAIISAHGADPATGGPQADRYAILLGRPESIQWAASFAMGLSGEWEAWVCQNLTLDNERIEKTEPEKLASFAPPSLALVLLVRKRSGK